MDFPLITFDSETGFATVGMPAVPRGVTGINKLVQIVVVAILKNGGQDVFDPNDGSGLRGMIGQYNYHNPSEVKTEVLRRIKLIESQMLSNQVNFNLPAAEKLKQLKVLDVVMDPVTAETAIRIQVINEAGQSLTTVV